MKTISTLIILLFCLLFLGIWAEAKTDNDPSLVSIKVERTKGTLVLTFENLNITSSNIEITLQSDTEERIVYTTHFNTNGNNQIVIPILEDQFKNAKTLTVISFYTNIYKEPHTVTLKQKESNIRKS